MQEFKTESIYIDNKFSFSCFKDLIFNKETDEMKPIVEKTTLSYISSKTSKYDHINDHDEKLIIIKDARILYPKLLTLIKEIIFICISECVGFIILEESNDLEQELDKLLYSRHMKFLNSR